MTKCKFDEIFIFESYEFCVITFFVFLIFVYLLVFKRVQTTCAHNTPSFCLVQFKNKFYKQAKQNSKFKSKFQISLFLFCIKILDEQYIKDVNALLIRLAEMIEQEHRCIWCGRYFQSASACRQHMIDLRHARIGSENDDVLFEFTNIQNEIKFENIML